MKQKVLITGASGFIGSFLVEMALQQNLAVYACVRPTSSRNNLQQSGVTLVEFSLGENELMHQQLKKIVDTYGPMDFVIHNAGITQASKVKQFFDINAEATLQFAKALKQLNLPLKKFVLISSLAAYGPGNQQFAPITTQNGYHPVSVYGQSKMMAETYLKSIPDFPHIIINPTAVYGPRDKDFLEFVKLINSGWEPYLGLHKQVVSMIYVKDLAKAVVGLMLSNVQNQSFIVSDGTAYNKEMLGTIVKNVLQKKTKKIKLPLSPIMLIVGIIEWFYSLSGKRPFLNREKLREISSANWHCDSSYTWATLQQLPDYPLEKGMQETIEWYKQKQWI